MLEQEESAQINITPLVDVSLTLVLFFIVTMPFSIIYGVTVKSEVLRKYGLTTTPQESVSVHLTDRGIFIKDAETGAEQPIPYEEYGVVMRQMIQLSTSKDVLFSIERDVPHGQTVWALDIAKQNGATDVSIMKGK